MSTTNFLYTDSILLNERYTRLNAFKTSSPVSNLETPGVFLDSSSGKLPRHWRGNIELLRHGFFRMRISVFNLIFAVWEKLRH